MARKRRRKAPTRREQATADVIPRSADFPIAPPGGKDYSLKGITPDLHDQFDAACKAAPPRGRSWRWVLLSLMHKFAKGEIQL